MRILCIDDIVPERRFGFGYPRAQSLLKLLASSGFEVTLFPSLPGRRADASAAEECGVRLVQYVDPPQVALTAFCRANLADFDAIWISRPRNLRDAFPIVAAQRTRQPIIYDAEALAFVREIARREVAGIPLDEQARRSLMQPELSLMRRADAIVSVSVPERELIIRECAKPTFLMGHVETAAPTTRGFAERMDLLFVGSFLSSAGPNTDSMVHFTREILPLIRRKLACRLHVVGYRSEVLRTKGILQEGPDVVIHGFVPDLRSVYEGARVMVVPTRYAAGVPSKLTEALAHGVPCVATPIIASQVPFHEPPVLSGANPAEFAARVVSLYTDEALWTHTRYIGEQYVRAHCAETAVRAQADALRAWIEGWRATRIAARL